MKLDDILKKTQIKEICCDKNLQIDNIVFNSKTVKKNNAFICLVGTNTDGHDYVDEALKNGASLIISQKKLDKNIPHVVVENTRMAFSEMSACFFDNCCDKLKIIGITGTNGKTTTTMVIQNILLRANKNVGVIGTLGYFINDKHYDCDLTTPDPMKLHEIFKKMYNSGVEYVAMEVSAHAIALEKVHGINFMIKALTNITQDHLDFFSDMENYIKTKLKFMSTKNKAKFLNVDDSSVHFLQDDLSFTYGIDHPADCFAMDISLQMGRSVYLLNLFDNVLKIDTKLSGKFNVYNVLLGASICSVLGIEAKTIVTAINNMQSVDGRFNVVSTEKGDIVIDFAHTPDGLENILCSLKQFNKKIICVFGCGGNRDSKKRPLMGAIAEKYCDEIYITSDNPRFENPDLIAEDILEGVKGKNKFTVENSRIKAIDHAIRNMTPNSIVVICGKGGEKYQDINGIMYPFEDKQEVFKLLKQLNIKVIN